ncbi:Serine/threonine-protein phosphatase 2A regulatory subunit B'' subunit gamma [Plasmodiophora brassicae]|uniref:Serine/threonine-protein phosphatase 2A regulatory subunit B'' subunit gamma n=1 Tax=Plasmodiophora brassicae TaxID=37360 RepID=A0A3P3Y199_PLABS|nr:unnamed protein product [Plasmodiophora brassicae]
MALAVLERIVARDGEPTVESDPMPIFRRLYDEREKSVADALPKFFFKKTNESDLMYSLLDEGRQRFLDQKDASLPDDDELDIVFSLLMKYSTRVTSGNDPCDWIDYDGFSAIRAQCPPKTRSFFTARNFCRFARDAHDRINSGALYHFIVRKVSADSTRVSLTSLDISGSGSLTEADLERYVFDEIRDLYQLQTLEEPFYPFYVFTAVRYILFVLDPLRKGRVKISDLVSSPVMREFADLRHAPAPGTESGRSWFSAHSALSVYALYLKLDKDHNGMLSKQELNEYNDGAFTELFFDRVFQVSRTYNGEMDYKTFLDMELALQKRDTPQGLRYFFNILDVNHVGYLTGYNINLFFRAVLAKMKEFGLEPVRVEDVINEVFDMVGPSDPERIFYDDLLRSGVGHTVVSILIDVNGFWAYDNRESLNQEPDQV